MQPKPYLAHAAAGLSHSAAYLEAIAPGQAVLPILRVGEVICMPRQTLRNRVSAGTFPIASFMQGGRRMCLKRDVIQYLDGLSEPTPKRGARTKAERIAAAQHEADGK